MKYIEKTFFPILVKREEIILKDQDSHAYIAQFLKIIDIMPSNDKKTKHLFEEKNALKFQSKHYVTSVLFS